MGMNFTTWNDIVEPLADDADILQHLYDMLDADDQPKVHLGDFVSDQLWDVMHSIAIGRIDDPATGFFVEDFLRSGRCGRGGFALHPRLAQLAH
jgi:hypothetical protein